MSWKQDSNMRTVRSSSLSAMLWKIMDMSAVKLNTAEMNGGLFCTDDAECKNSTMLDGMRSTGAMCLMSGIAGNKQSLGHHWECGQPYVSSYLIHARITLAFVDSANSQHRGGGRLLYPSGLLQRISPTAIPVFY